ncbi:MAG TPA: hypothetical protein VFV38_33410 [Ktedonobacteraceae bacterium]|nr:hypothetical protein [Ktedonobacteraceae bacterium]
MDQERFTLLSDWWFPAPTMVSKWAKKPPIVQVILQLLHGFLMDLLRLSSLDSRIGTLDQGKQIGAPVNGRNFPDVTYSKATSETAPLCRLAGLLPGQAALEQ